MGLPHAKNLRKGRFSEAGRIYHITSATHDRIPVFADLYTGRCLVQALMSEQERAETLCYVIMPDHFHWLLQLRERAELSLCVRNVKSVSAHRINELHARKGKLWQARFHDHAVRREEDIRVLARYIVSNPLRKGLVNRLADYPHWDAIWLR